MGAENCLKDLESIDSSKTTAMKALGPEASDHDKEPTELTNMPKMEKKKSPKPSKDAKETSAEEDAEFNPSLLKKKKKKKVSPGALSFFDSQLADAGVLQPPETTASNLNSDPSEYKLLLSRFYTLLYADRPELVDGSKTSKKRIPALVLYRESKKTIFATCPKLCEYLQRPDEHVAQYLFAELGTTGNFDGTRRLVIKGKFQQMQLETVIKRYMFEYVHCHTCNSLDTDLKKGENRLVFLTCNKCESRRSVRYVLISFTSDPMLLY